MESVLVIFHAVCHSLLHNAELGDFSWRREGLLWHGVETTHSKLAGRPVTLIDETLHFLCQVLTRDIDALSTAWDSVTLVDRD